MATIRHYHCAKCPPRRAGGLFGALLGIAKRGLPDCERCEAPYKGLRLKFDFGLNAGHSECTVLDSFTSKTPQTWRDKKGNSVFFYPFLVVLNRHGKGRATWLPYWHVIKKGKVEIKKYGQWAPFMDQHIFHDLITQARRRGYLGI
jgi:hypothetical protein